MKVYRLALTQFCDTSGEGAKIYGGRWNLPGTPTVYAGSSVSASLLERLTIDPELLAADRYIRYAVMVINIPDQLVFIPKRDELPLEWNQIPAVKASMEYGTKLLKSGLLCFAVPSVVDQNSLNHVINPLSQNFSLLDFKIYPLELDRRILR
jgi:RES domain-containing protein